ncbi:MAG: hypothetical protein HYT36_02840 [Candidatus Staskawiczbacteria bacterium]|nr:hypothetical protein [Candidatus Staskawiczbacteria bacterium]
MAKKIYDIKPPELADKLQEKAEIGVKKDNLKSKTKKPDFLALKKKTGKKKSQPAFAKAIAGRQKSDKNILLVKIFTGAGIFAAIFIIYLFFKLPMAKVDIWPKTETVNFQETVVADTSIVYVDVDNKVIPAAYFEEEMEFSREFPATGNSSNDGKAGGTFIIYNKCDFFQPVILKTGTHFISDSDKYFKILSKAVVPSARKEGGKIIPGSVLAEVEASEGGEEYNIKPASFSVPKFAGTVYYYCIYAQSKDAMAGGFSSAVKKITEEDIQNARDAVEKQLLTDIENSLKSKISSDHVIISNAISSKIVSRESATKAGVAIDKFNYSAKAKASSLVFKKADLDKFAAGYIVSKMEEKKRLVQESLDVKYNADTVDFDWGKIALKLEFSGKIYGEIDKNSLAFLLRRKTGDQINETVNNNLGDRVSKVKVNFWPFWVKKSPKNQKSITVELRFD